MVFAQDGKAKKSDRDVSNITCYCCEKKGHYAKECPKKGDYMHTIIADEEEVDDECQEDGPNSGHIFHQTKFKH